MIPFNQAYEIIMENAAGVATENVDIAQALNRVLAKDVRADRAMPAFYKSAVDGYACYNPKGDQKLELLETIAAGVKPQFQITPGTCSKIMTGAEVPEGANWVVMVEYTEVTEDGKIYIKKPGQKSNIAKKGEDFQQEDLILDKGTILQPQHIAILAAVGEHTPLVSAFPAVNIIATGDELVEPSMLPTPNQIRNSNASQLRSQLQKMHIFADYSGIVKDNRIKLQEVLSHSLQHYHITLITGGVSMGDYDYVPSILEHAGVEVLFHKIAMKPGKPTLFGKRRDHFVFGLPGNPVSAFLQFELLVKPLIYRMMGGFFSPVIIKLALGEDIWIKSSSRDTWKPVKIKDGKIFMLDYHGSGHIHAIHQADGFICIPAGGQGFQKGAYADVRQI